jgi:hypothetical protein
MRGRGKREEGRGRVFIDWERSLYRMGRAIANHLKALPFFRPPSSLFRLSSFPLSLLLLLFLPEQEEMNFQE